LSKINKPFENKQTKQKASMATKVMGLKNKQATTVTLRKPDPKQET